MSTFLDGPRGLNLQLVLAPRFLNLGQSICFQITKGRNMRMGGDVQHRETQSQGAAVHPKYLSQLLAPPRFPNRVHSFIVWKIGAACILSMTLTLPNNIKKFYGFLGLVSFVDWLSILSLRCDGIRNQEFPRKAWNTMSSSHRGPEGRVTKAGPPCHGIWWGYVNSLQAACRKSTVIFPKGSRIFASHSGFTTTACILCHCNFLRPNFTKRQAIVSNVISCSSTSAKLVAKREVNKSTSFFNWSFLTLCLGL